MAQEPRESVELFHLQFLRQLCAGPDRALFTLKGGCNLRCFFGSVRYSDDVDLDVTALAKGTLSSALKGQLPQAIHRVLSLSYDDYRSQVVAYLAPDQAPALQDREIWDAMQLEIVQFLKTLQT